MASGSASDDNSLFRHLSEIFPEACPNYLSNLCHNITYTPHVLNWLISEVLNSNYPKCRKLPSPEKKIGFLQQFQILKQMLPNADPSYLEDHCRALLDKPDELKRFVLKLVESSDYPTKQDYLVKEQNSSQVCFYTKQFDVTKFLKIIPDPESVFGDPKRKVNLDDQCYQYAFIFLSNSFRQLPIYTIRTRFSKNNFNVFATYVELKNIDPKVHLTCQRRQILAIKGKIPHNIPLLQEIAFIKHREEIQATIDTRKALELEDRRNAKAAGILQTCSCCYDEEVMPTDIYECEKGCIFCKDCIQKATEVAYGNGKLEFPCLDDCSSYFSLHTLQAVLNPNMFSKIIQKKQLEEVKAAGMKGLEMCPYCDFAIILPEEEKLFRCLNPECMKESCRLCKELAHLPLRCEEVEKPEDVKLRTYIEDKMSEALFRKCYKCGLKFIKADGCNRMTCSCGAKMCYICGAAVKDYTHFNGPGGDRFDLCPLFNDTNKLHEQAVLKAAKVAKKEKGVDSENPILKIDPTVDIETHYKEMGKRNPASPEAFRLPADLRALIQQQMEQLENIMNADF